MFNFSGLWKDPASTITGVLGLAITIGLLPVASPVVVGVTAVASVLKLFQAAPSGK